MSAGLAALVVVSCGDGRQTPASGSPPDPAPAATAPAVTSSAAASTSPSSSAAVARPAPPRPLAPREREGETSVEALFERARTALVAGDDLVLVRCLEPGARRAWLSDTLLAIEVEAQDPLYQDVMGRRRATAALRARVLAHVRDERRPAAPPRSLQVAAVEAALLERVDAPDQLLAELLTVARQLGHPLDPVGAVTRAGADPRRPGLADAGAKPAAGLARALHRIERSKDLAEVHLEDDQGIALVRGADGGLEPVRLVRRGDTLWIDES